MSSPQKTNLWDFYSRYIIWLEAFAVGLPSLKAINANHILAELQPAYLSKNSYMAHASFKTGIDNQIYNSLQKNFTNKRRILSCLAHYKSIWYNTPEL